MNDITVEALRRLLFYAEEELRELEGKPSTRTTLDRQEHWLRIKMELEQDIERARKDPGLTQSD